MKRICLALILLLCLLAASAHADTRAYTYGGSGQDVLYEAAVSADGRIVLTGSTDSSDGTLATRTKTGRSGWALCIDTQGHVLWNFCTRTGSYDTLRYPVFHADGSVSMLLDTSHDGLYEVVWIRLDAQGREQSRRTLDSRGMPWLVRAGGVHDSAPGGYIVHVFNKKTTEEMSLLYTFDGEFVDELAYTQTAVLPAAALADGTRIEIQNSDDPPLDVTVSFVPPMNSPVPS